MKTAVMGLGFMGSMHVRAIAGTGDLAAVYSADPVKLAGDLTAIRGNLGGGGQRFDFSGVKQYNRIPDLLADPEIEAGTDGSDTRCP